MDSFFHSQWIKGGGISIYYDDIPSKPFVPSYMDSGLPQPRICVIRWVSYLYFPILPARSTLKSVLSLSGRSDHPEAPISLLASGKEYWIYSLDIPPFARWSAVCDLVLYHDGQGMWYWSRPCQKPIKCYLSNPLLRLNKNYNIELTTASESWTTRSCQFWAFIHEVEGV